MNRDKRQRRQSHDGTPPHTAGDSHGQRAHRRLDREQRQRVIFAAALPAQVALPQVAKAAPADRMPAGIARHPHPEARAPYRGGQRGVLAKACGHRLDAADQLQIAAAQQHRLTHPDAIADAIDGDQPARPAAIEERSFELTAKSAGLGRHRHRRQQADARSELTGKPAQLVGAEPRVDVAQQHQLVPRPPPSAAQIIELGVG